MSYDRAAELLRGGEANKMLAGRAVIRPIGPSTGSAETRSGVSGRPGQARVLAAQGDLVEEVAFATDDADSDVAVTTLR